MEKTAVEYLIEQLEFALPNIEWSNYRNEIDRAKEMEKQQIIDANISGQMFIAATPGHYKNDAEEYYNQTFKQN
jgi:hypothetical protein